MGRHGRRRILVAEDHEVNWLLVERLLARRGHLAVRAVNGEQALERLSEERFDLVLMDCQMPLLDGCEATRELRRRELSTPGSHVPVVAITAGDKPGNRESCLAAGMDDYVPKPITGAVIDGLLDRWLDHPQNGARAVDQARLDELRALFPGEETANAIAALQADVDAQLQRLATAVREHDPQEAAAAAHRIKGSAFIVGASGLAEVAEEIQTVAHADLASVGAAADRLEEHWRRVSAALEHARARR